MSSSQLDSPSVDEIYTVFSSRERCMIVAILGVAMLVSPLTATIYLPLLPLLSLHFRASIQAINLTITVYIIFQALAPLLLASTSDFFGRRPIYISTFALYTVASLGLALNRPNYAALIVLRALQSLGASAVLSVSYGTVADITVPAKRGKMLGPILAAGNVGTGIGPIVGGWIALGSGSFRWAFWALVIFGGVMLTVLALLMPETARNVVGNGSIQDHNWNKPLWKISQQSWRARRSCHTARKDVESDDRDHNPCAISSSNLTRTPTSQAPTRSLRMTSPLSSIRVIFYRDTSLIIWISSSFYALWYCIQASIPSTYRSPPYAFNELGIGLAYLPGSAGVILSMYLAGKAMDHNYQRTAAQIGFTVDKVNGDDVAKFPIEHARSRGCAYLLVLSFAIMVGYGWAIDRGAHVALPLVLQFLQGFLSTWLIQCFSALLVDVFPETPSTAATAGNMTRCVLSAVAVAVLQPLVDVVGKGWVFSLLGLLSGMGGLAAHTALRKWGMEWRRLRGEKGKEQQQQQQQQRQRDTDQIKDDSPGTEKTIKDAKEPMTIAEKD